MHNVVLSAQQVDIYYCVLGSHLQLSADRL